MRVLYVGSVPPIRGGVAQHGGRLVETLRAAGHEVEVLSWCAQYPRLLFPGEQVIVRHESNPLGARFSLRWWDPSGWWLAGREARRFDLLVFPWIHPFQALALRTMLFAAGSTPSVAFVHNALPHEPGPFDQPLTRWVLRHASAAVVHAESLRDELLDWSGLERVRVVHFPSQLDLEPSPLPPTPPLRLLFLGFVRPYKGLDLAVDALRLLRERGREVTLTVAGEFWEPVEGFEGRLDELGLQDAVHLIPRYATDEEIAQHLREHHLLVAPYRSATQSGVVPLALAAGRAVVATTVGGLPERVVEGENGTLAAPDDPAAFADAVERAADRLDELAAGAAADRVSWKDVAASVVARG